MNLRERLRWWSRAARARGAKLKRAQARRKHFDQVADREHKKWVKAKKEKRRQNAARAKRRARRASRKAAWWDEQADDLRDGYKKAVKRREGVKRRIAARKQQQSPGGFTTPDKPWNSLNRPVCGWFVPILDEARQRGWRGYVVSGVRTPEYSVQLCRNICGSDSCPGLCAGRSSNHNATSCEKPQGAIDVTDYYTLSSVLRQMGNPIFNDLPIDRVHFSATGK
jgi:hypothetical protein